MFVYPIQIPPMEFLGTNSNTWKMVSDRADFTLFSNSHFLYYALILNPPQMPFQTSQYALKKCVCMYNYHICSGVLGHGWLENMLIYAKTCLINPIPWNESFLMVEKETVPMREILLKFDTCILFISRAWLSRSALFEQVLCIAPGAMRANCYIKRDGRTK